MLPYMQTSAASFPADVATVYPSYLPAGGFLATHGFGGGGSEAYAYDASAYLPASPQTGVVPGGGDSPASGVPSIGSYAHLSGQCSRCCFHPKGRCANGYSCQFCHFDHDKRPRNGKKKRYRRHEEGGEVNGDDEPSASF
jgi:hypothetical protein